MKKLKKFSRVEVDLLYQLVEKITGNQQSGPYRKEGVLANVVSRMEKTGCPTLTNYLEYLKGHREEFDCFISAITIHNTHWFRELPHYFKLRNFVEKKFQKIEESVPAPLHILCLACSTGEEIYSLGMVMETIRLKHPTWEYQIDGMDLDPLSIEVAKKGIYSKKDMEEIPQEFFSFLRLGKGDVQDYFAVDQEIRKRAVFRVGNLQHIGILGKEIPTEINYDVIFCRNVLIYFSQEVREKIVRNLVKKMGSNGILTLGHSEALIEPEKFGLTPVWNTSYLKGKEKPDFQGRYILVLEPSPLFRDTMLKMVERENEKLPIEETLHILMAGQGKEASDLLNKKLRIDMILMGLKLSDQEGKSWLQQERKFGMKVPVLVLTDINPLEANDVFEILEMGGVDLLSKNILYERPLYFMDKILFHMKNSFSVGRRKMVHDFLDEIKKKELVCPEVLLIGASTGGIEAMGKLLRDFPADTPPLVIVQHIPPEFAPAFAFRLEKITGLMMGKAAEGEELKRGTFYLSDGDYHIGIKKSGKFLKLIKSTAPPDQGLRPSVNFLFHSALPIAPKVMAILLTGMGEDGANAMLRLKEKGAITLAQNEESCVVFGMPRVAIQMKAARFVGNINDIRRKCELILQSQSKKDLL